MGGELPIVRLARFLPVTCGFLILALSLFSVCGCSALDAWKGGLGYNHKTGQIDGKMQGAGKGGEYNENTGLNLGLELGDNTIPALLVAGTIGVVLVAAYPVGRKLRLWSEKRENHRVARRLSGQHLPPALALQLRPASIGGHAVQPPPSNSTSSNSSDQPATGPSSTTT